MHQNNRSGHHNQGRRPPQPAQGKLPNVSFAKPLDSELFNTIALQAAKIVSSARQRNKTSQLRRFYDELMLWERRVTQQPEKFQEYLPFIRMMNAKVAYAKGRDLVDSNFVNFFSDTLKQVTNAETLTTCKLFWEAFMGFYKQERQD